MSLWGELRSAVRIIGGTILVVAGLVTGQAWMVSGGLALLSYEGQSQAARTMRNKARDAYNESLQDRKQMIRSATSERRVVLGRARVSGPMLYAQSTGAKNEYLHIIVALAGHECDAIEEVWLGDTKLPDPDGSGNIVTGAYAKGTVGTATEYATGASITLAHTPTSIKSVMVRGGRGGGAAVTYSLAGNVVTFISDTGGNNKSVVYEYDQPGTPLVRIKKYLGTSAQTADADLISESGGKWTSAHRLRGICYLYVRLQYDQDVFGATGIPNISAVVRGAKLYDPRKDSTAGGSGSHRLATPSTWQWSENSALALAWYLRDTQYGLGAAAAELPSAELIEAADVCDEAVTIFGGLTHQRYTCNGALSSADTALANKEAIEQSMAGKAIWTQGRWLILPGAPQAIDRPITETDVADGAITIIPAQARQRLRNRIVPTYVEPAQQWAEMQAPAATRTGYVTADGGFDVPDEMTLRMVSGSERAQRLAYVELDRSRQAMLVDLPCKLRAYNILPGRWVTLSLARYGWTNKTFEVISRRLDLGKMQTMLRLQEIADVYTPDYTDLGDVDLTPNTSLPSATALPGTLTGLAVATGTDHLLLGSDGTIVTRGYLTWTQSTSVWVTQGGSIEIETMRADGDATTDWVRHAPVAGSAVSTYLAPLEDQRFTLARLRPVTNRGRAGLWAYIVFLPVGKSQAPSNLAGAAYAVVPSGAIVSWTLPTDLDWAETEWRVGASWAAGTKVFRGAATQFNLLGYSPGTYQLWGANVDTTGNYSTTPTGLSVVVSSAAVISSLVLVLSNNNHSVPTDSGGNVTSYTGAASTLTVLLGGADDTANWTITKSFTNCGGTGGDAANVTNISSLTAAAGYVDFTATRSGWPTQTARFSLSKAGQGANGTRTAILEMYQWAVSAPTTWPSGTSTYTWATGAFTAPATPNGWTLTPGSAVSGQTLWVTRQLYTDTLTAATSSVTWAASSSVASGANGTNGQRIGVLEVYQWANTAPTSYPSGTSTYTWATGAFTAPSIANGWSLTPGTPSAGQTLWAISVAVSDNLTTSTSTANWTSSTVYAVGAAGSNGLHNALVYIYQRAAAAPSLPSASATYTFATGGITGLNNGWTAAIPSGTNPLYVSVATASSTGTTDTIAAGEWATPVVMAQDGTNGTAGINTAIVYLFQRATSTPAVPSSTLTYTFATNSITGTLGAWSTAVPSGTNPIYVTVATAASSGASDTIGTAEWATPVVLAQNGATGATGTPGTAGAAGANTATIYLFQRTATNTAPSLPSASVTYTFATGAATGVNNGWTQTLPTTGGAYRWVTIATALGTGATDTIAAGEWAAAALLAEDGAEGTAGLAGADGLNAATVYLFQRTTTNVAPSLPSASVTYTFATGATTGVNNGWARTMPTTGGSYRWVTQASALGTGTTDTIASGEWAAASLMAEDGSDATAYWLARSVAAVQQGLSGIFTPSTVTFSAFSATGAGAPAAYAGRFVIATSPDGSTYTTQYTSGANESSTTYTVPVGIKTMRVRLYLAGGTTTLLDEEVVPVVSDGALSPFSPVMWWEFNNGWDGWSATQITGAGNPSTITLTSTGTDPMFRSPAGLAITGALHNKVRARLRRLAGSGWQGDLYYTNGAHGESGSYYKRIATDPTVGGAWVILEWDMASLTAGGADWANGITSQLRIDLGTTASDVFEVDWVAVGRESAGVQDASIGTIQLGNGAATDVLMITAGAGGVTDSVVGDGVTAQSNAVMGTYTNGLTSSLTVQVSAQVRGVASTAPGALGQVDMLCYYAINGGAELPLANNAFGHSSGDALSIPESNLTQNIILAAGDTIAFRVAGFARSDVGSAQSISWAYAHVRLEAIKR